MKMPIHLKTCSAALLSLGMSLSAWSQAALPISNPGFESPVVSAGTFDQNLADWSVVGSPSLTGALHPLASDYPAGAPEGDNVAFVSASADGDGLSQILADPDAVLKAGTQYTLTAQVGNADSYPFEGYRVQLLANGVVLAEDDNSQSPAAGTFATSTVTYTYDAGLHETLLGEALEIRLLSKAQASGETDFDDIQLSVAFVDPVADAGGPYTIGPEDALALDASASVASAGATITSYDWDLDNDGTFGDVTGATPAAISFADLQNLWGMQIGENTIQLRVTDSAGKTAITSTTVQIQLVNDLVILFSGNIITTAAVEQFFTENFQNVAEIRHENFADFNAPATQDALNGTGIYEGSGPADLVVIGRSLNSGNYQSGVSDGYNELEIPVAIFSSYISRQDANRLGWHASGSTSNKSVSGDETTVTAAGESILGLIAGTHDLFSGTNSFNGLAGGTTEFGGGQVLATIGGDTLAAYWEPGSAPGNPTNAGVATFPGPRLLYCLSSDQDNNFNNLTQAGLNALVSAFHVATPLVATAIVPEIASLNPENNSLDVYPGTGQLVATFTRPIELTGVGSITIKNLGDVSGSSDAVINLPDALVTADSFNLKIQLASSLAFDTAYAVQISGDAVTDTEGTPFPGINDDVTWTFATAEENLNPPVITGQSPVHQASAISVASSIVATFDQNLIPGTGDIVIKDLEDGSSTQTISVTDESQVAFTDNVLTINPASSLESGRSYAVLIATTALRNFSDVNFAGITDDAEWNFTSSTLASQLGILDITANGGINPKTGEPWTIGDRYNLLFVTTGTSDALSTDIADYNAFVQAEAAAQTGTFANMASANWFALGSTTSTDAVDNVTIYGPVINTFNNVTIAVDATDFWDFKFTEDRTDLEGNLRNIWTGTTTGGVADGGDELGATNNNTRIHWTGWTDWGVANRNEPSDSQQHIMGISEPLFVYDTMDAADPSLLSIADDAAGGPVALDDTPVITYTVTFDEAMLPSTVTTDDFSNAGTAAATIDSVVQQEDGAVFLVTVTPTAEGTLQLQINQSAALTDLNGNPLDTSLALVDDTVITVEAATAAGYSVWADGFPALTDPDPALDFDGGGLATALEWVLGGDPTNGSDDANITPVIDNTSDPDGKLLFTFRRNIEAEEDPETTIIVEYGSDLTGWTAAVHQGEQAGDITVSVVTDGFAAGIDAVTVALPPALATDDKLFVRLNVDVPTTPVE